ncbi:MAG TPA: SRPBCC family protein [Gemmatimonadaceae bacterium]|nr:SRPBCC family protein [Gemmatimonadaceae bacterium]
MARIELTTRIAAPLERCFDLSRSVELHTHSTAETGERAVAGRTSGLLELGEQVTWEARHFGVRQRLTSCISAYDRPSHFRDSMVRGAFRRIDHDHYFTPDGNGGTIMRDVLEYDAPLGVLGRIAERLVLTAHLHRLLERRNEAIKSIAESDQWRSYGLPEH